jgi:hypothetical protein
MVMQTCNSSYWGGRGGSITNSNLDPAKLGRPFLKNKIQKDWEYGSIGRALV